MDLFLSYARNDDERFVKRLYQDLAARGYSVWWDQVSMPSRALTFIQEIREAVNNSDRLIAVLGPQAMQSEYVTAEWKHALNSCKVVVPILRRGEYSLLPAELAEYHCPDFRLSRPYNEALAELLRILKEPVLPLGRLSSDVPGLPPHFQPRPEEIRMLARSLLTDIQRPVVITSREQTSALQGMGGVGKSVLAAAFARDCRTRRAFTDGIVWLPVGQKPDLARLVKAVGLSLGDDAREYTDFERGRSRLPETLRQKACLLVLDDLWDVHHAELFLNALGSLCRLLVTTRDGGIVTALGAQAHPLDVLTDAQSLALLARWAGQEPSDLPPEAYEVARECGNLPLALAIVGAMVRDNSDRWENALHKLRSAELQKLRRQLPNYPYTDLLRAIQVSIDALDPRARERYLDFAVFSDSVSIPEETCVTFWEPLGWTRIKTQDTLDLFVNRSLARRDERGHLLLHDLLLDYVRNQARDVTSLHRRMVEAYALRCPAGWYTGPNDNYFFQAIVNHQIQGEMWEDVGRTLCDLRFVREKCRYASVFGLEWDYSSALSRLRSSGDHDAVKRRRRPELPQWLADTVKDVIAGKLDSHPTEGAGPTLAVLRGLPEEQRTNYPNTTAVEALSSRLLVKPEESDHSLYTEMQTLPATYFSNGPSTSAQIDRSAHSAVEEEATCRSSPNRESLLSLLHAFASFTAKYSHLLAANPVHIIDLAYNHASVGPVAEQAGLLKQSSREPWVARNARPSRMATPSALIRRLEGHSDGVNCVALSGDGRIAVSGSDDTSVRVWDATTGACLRELQGHNGSVSGITLSFDGKVAVSASQDRTLRIWDITSGVCSRTIEMDVFGRGLIVMTPDASLAITCGGSTLFVLDVLSGRCIRRLDGHVFPVEGVGVTPDGRVGISGGRDGIVRIWDVATGACLRTLWGHTSVVQGVALSQDAKIAVSASWGLTLRVWDVQSGACLRTLRGHSHILTSVALSSDGRLAATGSSDGTVRLWDLVSGSCLRVFEGHRSYVQSVALSSDMRTLVSASWDRSLRVWDPASRVLPPLPSGHRTGVESVVISRDGCYAVSGGTEGYNIGKYASGSGYPVQDYTMGIWDTSQATLMARIEGDGECYNRFDINPASRLTVIARSGGVLELYALPRGEKVKELSGLGATANEVSFNQDGSVVAAGNKNPSVDTPKPAI